MTDCIVDAALLARVTKYPWQLDSAGFPCSIIRKKPIRLGEFLTKKSQFEYLNGNPLDNRLCNLYTPSDTATPQKRGVMRVRDGYQLWMGRDTAVKRGEYASRPEAEAEHDRIAREVYGADAPCLVAAGASVFRLKWAASIPYDYRDKRVPATCTLPVDRITGVVGESRGRYTDADTARMQVLGRPVDDAYLVKFWNEYGGISV